jgi:hypothetical protein
MFQARTKLKSQKQRDVTARQFRGLSKNAEMATYIEQMKEEFRGLVPDALGAIRYALQIQKDARIGHEVLRNVGVAPPQGQPEPLPPTQTSQESREEHQARGIAAVILESHRHFRVELPPDMRRVLDSHPEKGTEETSLPRPESGHISGCR